MNGPTQPRRHHTHPSHGGTLRSATPGRGYGYSLPGQRPAPPRRGDVPVGAIKAPDVASGTGLSAALVALPELRAGREFRPDGTVLFDAADPADRVYHIHRGQVRLYQINPGRDPAGDLEADPQGMRLVAVLRPGQWFGTAALAGLPAQGLRAVTHGDTVVSVVSADRLRGVLVERPGELLRLVCDVVRQDHEAREVAGSLLFEDCHRRLLSALVRLSDSAAAAPSPDREAKTVDLKITHMQLAQYIGVARETVSLALGDLRRKGLLATGRNRLTFDPDVLRAERNGG